MTTATKAGRPRALDDAEIRRIYNLRHTVHMPVKDIAELVGVSTTTVYKMLRQFEESAAADELALALQLQWEGKDVEAEAPEPVDMVNHPPHYTRGPQVQIGVGAVDPENSDLFRFDRCRDYFVDEDGGVFITIEHIEVFRHIKDPRLATALKYIWRVAFGGKEDDREDIGKARFYLKDYLNHPVE